MIQTWKCRLCGEQVAEFSLVLTTKDDMSQLARNIFVAPHFATHDHFYELIEVTTKEDDNESSP